jgi:two-component system, OmpR family, response regulator
MRRVLVADDDSDIRMLAQMSLTRVGGYDVVTVGSGAEVLGRLSTWRPDAVILDVRMRDVDGPGVLRRLRADESTCDIPVVFLTAGRCRSETVPLHRLDAQGILVKPFDPMRMPHQLAEMLGWA